MRTIQLTEEERKAGLTQIGARLTDLKRMKVESNDFNRILESTEFIKPIQSLFDKILTSEKTK